MRVSCEGGCDGASSSSSSSSCCCDGGDGAGGAVCEHLDTAVYMMGMVEYSAYSEHSV